MEDVLDAQEIRDKQLNYAGFWIRFAAAIIDGILLWVVSAVFNLLIIGSIVNQTISSSYFIVLGLNTIVGILYFCLMESSEKQGTIGKMAVGIKIGNLTGERISFVNALGRYFAKMVSALILMIGYMMAGWDSKKQALHDKMATTVVYYK